MAKWLFRGFVLVALIAVTFVGLALWTAQRTVNPVGFDLARAAEAKGAAFGVAIWYPTLGTPRPTTFLGGSLMSVARDGAVRGEHLPLVVISHGNGGGPASHADLALALADAGYVVAAPMHPGDNYQDSAGLGRAGLWADRNRQLISTVDYVTKTWRARDRIDPSRIGAFGFSAGGFTVLTAVGARPELRRIATHCAKTPEFVCAVLKQANSPLILGQIAETGRPFIADARIKAAVLAAPGLGFTFDNDALKDVRVPIQLWTGGRDDRVPDASNGAILRAGLGARVDARVEPGAGHLSFLAPCTLLRPPALCRDEGTFDRKAFHQEMNAEVVQFFNGALHR